MYKFLCLILLSTLAYAENSETAGGYDYKAAQRAEAKHNAEIDAEIAKMRKARQAKAKLAKAQKDREALLPENMAKITDTDVCIKAGIEWRKSQTDNWIREAIRRNLALSVSSIKAKSFNINGYDCDVFAAFGKPKRYNRRVTKYGTSVQFVYDGLYVYSNNGVVTSWSD